MGKRFINHDYSKIIFASPDRPNGDAGKQHAFYGLSYDKHGDGEIRHKVVSLCGHIRNVRSGEDERMSIADLEKEAANEKFLPETCCKSCLRIYNQKYKPV